MISFRRSQKTSRNAGRSAGATSGTQSPRRRLVRDDVPRPEQGPASEQPASSTSGQFRRNQTLSSYRHDTPEESSRHKAHHLALQRRKIGSLFVVALAVAMLLVLLLWQLVAQAQVTTSTKPLAAAFYGQAYDRAISDYLNLHPAQRLRFALDDAALSSYVSSTLPEVESLSLNNGFAGLARGEFAITFRTPVAGWQINGKQYYVDADGVVFEKNYYTAPVVQIVDESGITPEQGTAVASTRLLGFLGKAVSLAQGRGYTVSKAVLPQDTTRTVDLYFTGITIRARLTIDRGAGEQMEDFDRAYRYMQTNGIAASYVDVRVSGRAAYQ